VHTLDHPRRRSRRMSAAMLASLALPPDTRTAPTTRATRMKSGRDQFFSSPNSWRGSLRIIGVSKRGQRGNPRGLRFCNPSPHPRGLHVRERAPDHRPVHWSDGIGRASLPTGLVAAPGSAPLHKCGTSARWCRRIRYGAWRCLTFGFLFDRHRAGRMGAEFPDEASCDGSLAWAKALLAEVSRS